jgi:5-methyltetrahydropteroyltriglutamate--homocysteine methyltransferase
MLRSTDRILTSHVGALPRPLNLPGREAKDYTVADVELAAAVRDIVKKQADHGITVLGDGEFGKSNFLYYVRHRFDGFAERALNAGEAHPNDAGGARDLEKFPAYFEARGGLYPLNNPVLYCAGKISYRGQDSIGTDIRNLKAAMQAAGAQEGFLTSVSPCTVAITMPNGFYRSDDEYHVALAEALHDEYRAVTDAGLVLQIDEPGLPGLWQTHPDATISDYRRSFAKWVELLNFALRDCPPSQVRLHCCWGSYKGPHTGDIGLEHFVDLLFGINATCHSIEGGNPRHEHEWAVFEDNKLPDGKMLMPGVVSHSSDTIEHPELVAQRLMRYAGVVGRENVIAGTDCGLRRVHDEICWAKMTSLVAGAAIASRKLWS